LLVFVIFKNLCFFNYLDRICFNHRVFRKHLLSLEKLLCLLLLLDVIL
jgi:hypothetical protein